MQLLRSNPMRRAFLASLCLGALATAPASAGSWQRIDNPGPVLGLDGKSHTATCSGFPGTDPSFRFWARKGTSENLVVFFEGGGACWDNLTCSYPAAGLPSSVPQFFVPQVPPGTDPSQSGGIFRSDNPANPVAEWNMVYIPYCTGDLHTGSATRTYTSVGNPALGLPPGAPVIIEHRGFDNFMVVLEWARKNFASSKSVLVTGVSAGGYGAEFNSPWLGRAFPQAHLYVLGDSSQGVTTQAFDTGNPGRASWNPQYAPWIFGSNGPSVPGLEVLRWVAQGQPRAKVAQFTPSFDATQIGFYAVMKQFYGPGGSCPNPAIDWYQQMSKQLIADGNEVGNYRYFVAGGSFHTILDSPGYYTDLSAGTTVAQWLGNMLSNRGGTNGTGGRWFNAACPTCLIDLPCQ